MCHMYRTLRSDWMLTGVFVMAAVLSSSCDVLKNMAAYMVAERQKEELLRSAYDVHQDLTQGYKTVRDHSRKKC